MQTETLRIFMLLNSILVAMLTIFAIANIVNKHMQSRRGSEIRQCEEKVIVVNLGNFNA